MKFENVLRHINALVELNPSEEVVLLSKLKYRRYLKGQYVLQAGDVSRHETFILSGKVRTFYPDQNGNEHIVAFGIEDWWVGDICSLATQTPAEFDVQCLEDTEVAQIAFEDMEELYKKVPKLERYFRLIIQKAYANMTRRIISNHSRSARERYLQFLDQYPEIALRVPQYMIASYLGITKEFLSTIRNQISNEAKS